MSTHPNTILMVALTPDGLSKKTLRAILAESTAGEDELIIIDGKKYFSLVMEEEYNESWQIQAKEGDIVLHDFITYGYGKKISWAALENQKNNLEAWAKGICERHHCTYEIFITANYW